jgi:hypothetical protein
VVRAAFRGGDVDGNTTTTAALLSPPSTSSSTSSSRSRSSSLVIRCVRKPMRLSNNKKKAKVDAAKLGKQQRGAGGGVQEEFKGAGGLSPAQRVKAAKHEARRWLGQHFLIDHTVILDAVEAADVQPGDRILEIGPGTGNLTVELLKAGAVITAVEKDRGLADKLMENFADDSNLEVCTDDFLKWNVGAAFKDVTEAVAAAAEAAAEAADGGGDNGGAANDATAAPASAAARARSADLPRDGRAKVVANIPYNITTDILKTLLPMGDTFSNMVGFTS